MKYPITLSCSIALLFAAQVYAGEHSLLRQYASQGAGPFSATSGEKAWEKVYPGKDGQARSCVSCHGSDLTKVGKHAKTGKRIEPLALSVNPRRLTDEKKVEKWFRRNCRWTLGRLCTPQEKGDFITFIVDK